MGEEEVSFKTITAGEFLAFLGDHSMEFLFRLVTGRNKLDIPYLAELVEAGKLPHVEFLSLVLDPRVEVNLIDNQTKRWLCNDFAQHVLHLFEKRHPSDRRKK